MCRRFAPAAGPPRARTCPFLMHPLWRCPGSHDVPPPRSDGLSRHDLESGHAESRHTPERASGEGTISSRPTSRCSPKTASRFGALTQSDFTVIEKGRPRPVGSLAAMDTRRRSSASGLDDESAARGHAQRLAPQTRRRHRDRRWKAEYDRRAVGCAQGEDHRADDRRGPDDLAAAFSRSTPRPLRTSSQIDINERTCGLPSRSAITFVLFEAITSLTSSAIERSQPTPVGTDAVLCKTSRRH
jgi:hypothetical protein